MMGRYLDMVDDEEVEMTRDQLNAATAELAEELFGDEAGEQMRAKLKVPADLA